MSVRGKVGMWLKLIAPRVVDVMAENAMKKVHYE